MSLIRWKKKQCCDPFQDFFDMDHPFSGLSLLPVMGRESTLLRENWYPSLDVSEDNKNVYIRADLPGISKDDVKLSIDGSILTFSGERKEEVDKKEKNYHRIERSYGAFKRSLDLGTSVDVSKIKANYKNGVLEITAPKTAQSASKQIDIEEK